MKRTIYLVLLLSSAAGSAPALTPIVPPPPPPDTRQCWIEPWYCKPPIVNPPAAPRLTAPHLVPDQGAKTKL